MSRKDLLPRAGGFCLNKQFNHRRFYRAADRYIFKYDLMQV